MPQTLRTARAGDHQPHKAKVNAGAQRRLGQGRVLDGDRERMVCGPDWPRMRVCPDEAEQSLKRSALVGFLAYICGNLNELDAVLAEFSPQMLGIAERKYREFRSGCAERRIDFGLKQIPDAETMMDRKQDTRSGGIGTSGHGFGLRVDSGAVEQRYA
ncbi:MAG: hypothetical protein VW547_00190 [Alphaproteobacteria bacterium]